MPGGASAVHEYPRSYPPPLRLCYSGRRSPKLLVVLVIVVDSGLIQQPRDQFIDVRGDA